MADLKTRPRKTVDDYMKLPEGTLAELIDGEILMSPSPTSRHQIVVGRMYEALSQFVHPRGLGQVLLSPLDVHLPSGDVVEPDLIYISSERRNILQDWIRGAPDLLIEIVSPYNIERDRLVKRELYARNSVNEYWIVDPTEKSVEVLMLSGGRYAPGGYFKKGDVLRSPILPDLSLQMTGLFEPPQPE
ncbi:MAG: Uma2 family endonuclease [Planctomycetes bacterium]|nr:Uma2 family endonuclease [Planctomycetota bacterium]